MADVMDFPDDWHDFLQSYSFVDSEKIYTNGSRLIPMFRVEQLIEHLLKAQEPRVMTLEEAQGADYCWYENRYANICFIVSAAMSPYITQSPQTQLECIGDERRSYMYDDDYNKVWRCWDKEPTDEQREAEPWNK